MNEAVGRNNFSVSGHDVAGCVASLVEIEAALGRVPQAGSRPSPFRRFDRLFIDDKYLARELRRRLSLKPSRGGVPRLERRSALSLLRQRIYGAAYDWPLAADAVLFASNLRSYYISADPSTIKIKGATRSAIEFGGEVETRRKVGKSGAVNVPAVIVADMTAAIPYVVDEFVAGLRPHWHRHRAILVNELTPQLWRMYQTFGTSLLPSSALFNIDVIVDRIKLLPLEPHWRQEIQCRDRLVDALLLLSRHKGEAFVVSFGHGDLSVGNLILTPVGKLCVVDWELAGQQPIAWDFRKILLYVPSIWEPLHELLANEIRQRRWQDAMDPRHQLVIALSAYIANCDAPVGRTSGQVSSNPPRKVAKIRAMLAAASRVIDKCVL